MGKRKKEIFSYTFDYTYQQKGPVKEKFHWKLLNTDQKMTKSRKKEKKKQLLKKQQNFMAIIDQ